MKSGQELDALVAEKVMGHTLIPEPIVGHMIQNDGHGTLKYHVPDYSTNIADAWPVVERMMRDKWDFSIYTNMSGDFQVEFCNDLQDSGCVLSETVPLGICLAAIAAIESTEVLA